MRFDPAYFRARGWWRDETLARLARSPGCTTCARPARHPYRSTHADLQAARGDRVTSLAAGLAGAGMRRGDIVVVHLPNIPEFVIAWLAHQRARRGHADGAHALRHSRARTSARATAAQRPPSRWRKSRIARPAGRHRLAASDALPALQLVIAVGGDVRRARSNFRALEQARRDKSRIRASRLPQPIPSCCSTPRAPRRRQRRCRSRSITS